ncbi:MAG TPA: hypothetical protein VET48_14665 [Steroidobacteraceae bacterium]|nr:hypothetical protein [Steroidobacteraceae bacterium]
MTKQSDADHLIQWQDRIQDAIEGNADAELRAHLQTCEICRNHHAKLRSLHAQLATKFANAPSLGADFSASVFAQIDSHEQARRAAAKQRAEQEFQKRVGAFRLDWREIFQRHFGNVVATLTVLVALLAGMSSLWQTARDQLHDSIASLPFASNAFALPIVIVVGTATIATAMLWWLRTKTR